MKTAVLLCGRACKRRATKSDPADVGDQHFAAAAAHARESAAWHYHEIATNHMVLSNKPDELADLLLDIA